MGGLVQLFGGRGGNFQELGHHALVGLLTVPWNDHGALGMSFRLLTEDECLVEVDLSAVSEPFGSNWFMLYPWSMSFFSKVVTCPFPSCFNSLVIS